MSKLYIIAALFLVSLTANAQTLTLQPLQNEIPTSDAGLYDRVEYIRQVAAGQMILASFPAKLDGYYFGPDAKRLIAKAVEEDNGVFTFTTEEMADTLDFLPDITYLITPTQDLDSIICLVPAKKIAVPATTTPLMLQEIDKKSVVTGISNTAVPKTDDEVIYDLMGRRQQSSPKYGIYILNSQKVIIRKR